MEVDEEDYWLSGFYCWVCKEKATIRLNQNLEGRKETVKQCLNICVPQLTDISEDDCLCRVCANQLAGCLDFIEKCTSAQTALLNGTDKKAQTYSNRNQSISDDDHDIDNSIAEDIVDLTECANVSSEVCLKNGPSSSSFVLGFKQASLIGSAPLLHASLVQYGVKVVNMSQNTDKRKKIILVGSTDVAKNLLSPSEDLKFFPCLVCGQRFCIPNHYAEHYMSLHLKIEDKLSKGGLTCTFCYFKFFTTQQLLTHLLCVHRNKMEATAAFSHVREIRYGLSVNTGGEVVDTKPPATSRLKYYMPKKRLDFVMPYRDKVISETSFSVSCKGLFNVFPDFHIDLHKNGIKTIRVDAGHIHAPKRVLLLGTTSDQPVLTNFPYSRDFPCLACTKSFDNEYECRMHYTEFHKYECVLCGEMHKNLLELRKHIKTHHKDKKVYECPKCKKDFSDYRAFCVHKKTYQDTPMCHFPCRKCKLKFKSKARFVWHLVECTKQSLEKLCHICGKKFKLSANLLSHISAMHNRKFEGICPVCGKLFNERNNYRAHMKTHDPERKRSIMCDKCPKQFLSIHTLSKHYSIKHNENAQRPHCDLCNKSFSVGYSIEKHKMLYHTRVAKYSCNICDEKFVRRDYLNNHIKRHQRYGTSTLPPTTRNPRYRKNTQKKKFLSTAPFLCKICNKVLAAVSYRSHYNMHLNHRPYKCTHCDQRFTNSSVQKRHEKLHDDPTYKLSCRICFGKFRSEALLQQHIDKKHKKLQYPCNVCGKQFGRRYLREIHKVNEHEDCVIEKKLKVIDLALKDIVRVIPEGEEAEYSGNSMFIVKDAIDENVNKEFKKLVEQCRDEL